MGITNIGVLTSPDVEPDPDAVPEEDGPISTPPGFPDDDPPIREGDDD